jgi:transcriptional regulator with XRE-family HTH domain
MPVPRKQADEDIAVTLGPRLKAARGRAGLTLKALSAATGLSQPFLSRLERGQVSASIANLRQICRVLGLPFAKLIAEEADTPAPAWAVFRGGGVPVTADGYTFRPIAPALRHRRMDAFVLDFPRGRGMDLVVAHEGEELLAVLDGRLRFRFGDEVAELGPGDAVQFDSSLPHSAAAIGVRPARALMVTVPAHGEAFGWQRFLAEASSPRPGNPRTRSTTSPRAKRRSGP